MQTFLNARKSLGGQAKTLLLLARKRMIKYSRRFLRNRQNARGYFLIRPVYKSDNSCTVDGKKYIIGTPEVRLIRRRPEK